MLVIGEKINVMSTSIGPAMKNREPKPIQELAAAEIVAGAALLDVNLGPATKGGPEMMEWVVNTIQEAVDARLCLDTTNAEAMEAGLKVCKNQPMINSTSAERARLEKLLPLAKRYEADIIGLAMTEAGISRDANERMAAAVDIIGAMMEFDVPLTRLYLDPLILPVCVAQQQAKEAMEAIKMFQQLNDPPLHTVVGLSNIYNGCPEEVHTQLAATYLTMLMSVGLDAAIADPMDKVLMNTIKTVEIFQNETLYAHSFMD